MEEIDTEEILSKPHKFWDTQPVKEDLKVDTEGIIKIGELEKVPKEETKLPANFWWENLDIDNES